LDYHFIEEVELSETVKVGGCDSGVLDTLLDASSCSYMISSGITLACGEIHGKEQFQSCVVDFLTSLVKKGDLLEVEKNSILNCDINNKAPVAICQDVEITIPLNAGNLSAVVEASAFNGGSFDPDGDTLQFQISPGNSFGFGTHRISLMMYDERGGFASCQAKLKVADGNKPPVALCRKQIEATAPNGTQCSGKININSSELDNGSYDPDGHLLNFSLIPPSPYPVGRRIVTLRVQDERGASTTCETTVTIRPDNPEYTPWIRNGNHAYRVGLCLLSWEDAKRFAAETTVCGAKAHLATITSEAERNVVRNLTSSLKLEDQVFWLGAFQPHNANAKEPVGNWTWVNEEGDVSKGFVDWNAGEPNSPAENCMIMLGSDRGYQWDDQSCALNFHYVEEVQLPGNSCSP